MKTKINLSKDFFTEKEKTLLENESFNVTLFKYSTGIEAVKLSNSKGYVTLLPFVGQQIWDMEFLGHNMVMKTIYDEPEVCYKNYGESYGCFLMHCGLSAIGNPTSEDTHLPHGELPIAKYKEAYILEGEDEKGKYIALSGKYTHKRAYEYNYEFSPECRLYEDASVIEMTISFKNNKEFPLEYFYLCHINYLPVDGAELIYNAKKENIKAHHEVPDEYPKEIADKTNAYLKKLDENPYVMNKIDKNTQSYSPEIVFTCKYEKDENGDAHTMQLLPDGYSCYVSHKPDELPLGIRWISRTEDEDALGMVLPATAEHLGYNYCKEKGYERYLNKGESITYHITTGILSPEESNEIKNKVLNLNK